jgi:hypothetical protein
VCQYSSSQVEEKDASDPVRECGKRKRRSEEVAADKQLYLSRIHMNPLVIHKWDDAVAFPQTVTQEEGDAMRLTNNDRCRDTTHGYYYAPFNYARADIQSDLDRCEAAASLSEPYSCMCFTCTSSVASAAVSNNTHTRQVSPASRNSHNTAEGQKALQAEQLMERQIHMKQREQKVAATAVAAAATPTVQTFEDYLIEHGGLNRHNIVNPKWHKKHPTAAKHLFGFNTYKETLATLWSLWPEELTADIKKLKSHKLQLNPPPTSTLEKVLVARMKMRRFYTDETLARMFGRGLTSIERYLNEWMPKFGAAGRLWSTFDIGVDYIEATYPEAFTAAGLQNIGALPDGKDMMTDTPRQNSAITRAFFSDKVHHSAVRWINWMTPEGLSFEHSDLILSRASEKAIVRLWGPRMAKLDAILRMLSDRGFAETAGSYPNFNAQLTPKFLTGRPQFTAGEVSGDRIVCSLRYTVEVGFSRLTNEACLKDVVPRSFFNHLQDACHWGHAMINLGLPFHHPKGAPVDYFRAPKNNNKKQKMKK